MEINKVLEVLNTALADKDLSLWVKEETIKSQIKTIEKANERIAELEEENAKLKEKNLNLKFYVPANTLKELEKNDLV